MPKGKYSTKAEDIAVVCKLSADATSYLAKYDTGGKQRYIGEERKRCMRRFLDPCEVVHHALQIWSHDGSRFGEWIPHASHFIWGNKSSHRLYNRFKNFEILWQIHG
jgi:hypothetical protein